MRNVPLLRGMMPSDSTRTLVPWNSPHASTCWTRHRPPSRRPLARGCRRHGVEPRGRLGLHAGRVRQGLLRRLHGGLAGLALPRPRIRDPGSAAHDARRLTGRTAGRLPGWVSSERGQEAVSGATRHRPLDRGGARSLSPLHLDRRWRHAVAQAEPARGPDGTVSLVGRVVGKPTGDSHAGGLRFKLRDVKDPSSKTGRGGLHGQRSRSLPDRPRHRRRRQAAERHVRRHARLDGDEVPVEVLGRQAVDPVDG